MISPYYASKYQECSKEDINQLETRLRNIYLLLSPHKAQREV